MSQEQRRHFRGVRGDRVANEPANIVVDAPALADGRNHRGEVVVEEDHGAGLPRGIGAGDPHRHADVGPLQRRGIVDPIAGHRHQLTLGLQCLDDP